MGTAGTVLGWRGADLLLAFRANGVHFRLRRSEEGEHGRPAAHPLGKEHLSEDARDAQGA